MHVTVDGDRRALCGQSMTGEPEMPAGTQVSCASCARKARRLDLDVNTPDEF